MSAMTAEERRVAIYVLEMKLADKRVARAGYLRLAAEVESEVHAMERDLAALRATAAASQKLAGR